MPLNEALDRAMKVYDQERLHPAPVEVIALGLGYKSANNGAALAAIASLRYFGLLERPKDGFLSITKAVESFKFSPSELQRRELLIQFLKSPPLYAELVEKYANGLPSDASLKYELIQRGFIPAGAESALSCFKQSVNFAAYFEFQAAQVIAEDDTLIDSPEEDEIVSVPSKNGAPVVASSTVQSTAGDEALDRIPVRLPGGRKAWLLIPTLFFEADKIRLKAQIDLLLTEDESAE